MNAFKKALRSLEPPTTRFLRSRVFGHSSKTSGNKESASNEGAAHDSCVYIGKQLTEAGGTTNELQSSMRSTAISFNEAGELLRLFGEQLESLTPGLENAQNQYLAINRQLNQSMRSIEMQVALSCLVSIFVFLQFLKQNDELSDAQLKIQSLEQKVSDYSYTLQKKIDEKTQAFQEKMKKTERDVQKRGQEINDTLKKEAEKFKAATNDQYNNLEKKALEFEAHLKKRGKELENSLNSINNQLKKMEIESAIDQISNEQQRLQVKYNNSFSGFFLAGIMSRGPAHLKKLNALQQLKQDLWAAKRQGKSSISDDIIRLQTKKDLTSAYDFFFTPEPDDVTFKKEFVSQFFPENKTIKP